MFGKLALCRQCCADCKLHEMLQVLARTASWHARDMAQFLDEIGSLARCLIFFGACGGPCMAPSGAAELMCGARAKKRLKFC